MSLDALVAEAGQVLGDARSLYGPAAVSGGWSSTAGLGVGRDGLAQAGDVLKGWGGASSSTHHAQSGGRVAALDNVIGADRGTASGFDGAARNSQSGRSGMDGVVDDTRRGVTAIAPSTDTPAGKTQMVEHLRSQLDRAKDLLRISEQRNALLATAIRNSSGGYGMPARGMGGGGMPGMGMPTGLPMMSGGGGGGGLSSLGGSGLIPNLSAFTRTNRPGQKSSPLTLHAPMPSGPGAEAFRAAIRRALDIKGITDPRARANWEAGLMVVADRESDFNPRAANNQDSNARNGNRSEGSLQFTRHTFAAYHEPGTANDRSDNVASAAAFVNYAMGRYHVSADGHDLAAKIQQADPTRPPKGY
ncbi:transglycosylase SLT domain-containing protein [Mycolicibacterium fortuitum]|uniref:transglycosylase SLT domain-containing protein n=3 Tax=Mycolicibacterium fortuitum TaxID=1766 RepID=UPI00148FB9AB|nr:transglycosylase SLT domain-containing protein [Mycolicibacterium fortuitum]MDV7195559.1 transglycosylase SLT domain-containing protein [Mycolicibacterium fortuitum]NOQ62293.1 transglycosylase SLT domain-containing protein [Mycolicibacterium fortuitum]